MGDGSKIIAGLEDAVAFARGDKTRATIRPAVVPDRIDVRAIRKRLGMTQETFALMFGFSVGSLRNWEQGHRRPRGSARVLLTIIDRAPEQVQKALKAA